MGRNLKKKKKPKITKNPKQNQNKLHWTNMRIFEECFLLKEKLVGEPLQHSAVMIVYLNLFTVLGELIPSVDKCPAKKYQAT